VLGSGRWEGVVKTRAGEFRVAFQMNVSGAGNRDLAGTVTGNSVSADISADLNNWRKPRRNVPGNLATEYAGTYTVLIAQPLPAAPIPGGVGYGRVTINTVGGVTLVGKLGDGSPIAMGATLVKKVTGAVFFPLFFPLDKKQGNISGIVTYSVQPESDLTADLDWSEPATTKVEPQSFAGQVSLTGARYAAPTTGGFAILASASGEGKVEVTLPAYTVPVTPVGAPSKLTSTATLNPTTQVVAVDAPVLQAQAFKMKIAPKTGLFSGTFKDLQLDKTIPFTGALMQKANGGLGLGGGGGVFVRGNKAGAVTLGPQ
jgi:hypothetical protein